MIKWYKILKELKLFANKEIGLDDLGNFAVDSLYGSMYGLNHRYMTLEDCLGIDFANVLKYTIKRISNIKNPLTFKKRKHKKFRQMGFGTYGWKYDHKIIEVALKNNLLIDTAEGYGYGKVEKELGKVFGKTEYTINVTTKVSRSHMSSKALPNAAVRSKNRLQTTPHYQIHFPNANYSDETIGSSLVFLRKRGSIKSIGLGNCSIDMIESMQSFLSDYSGDIIRSVQVCYSLIDRRVGKVLISYCKKRGIQIIGYSPLGQKFSKLRQPVLKRIAKGYGCTDAQIALSWVLSKGVTPIPRTNNIKHLEENMDAVNIKLSEKEIKEIEAEYELL